MRRTFPRLLLLLLVARGLLVASAADVFFYGEEGAKGAAAKALVDGLGIPVWQLGYVYHEGGGFLVSLVSSVFFRLLGPSVLALKLTALATTTLLLGVGWRLASELFGRKAGVIFGLCFVLCPESYLRFSLLALGTHFEALILVVLVLQFGSRVALRAAPELRDWAVLGLAAGFGAYVSLQVWPATLTAGLALLVLRPRRLVGAGAGIAALAFAIGAIPLWWMMSHVGTAAVRVRSYAPDLAGLRGWEALRQILRPLVEAPDPWTWARAIATVAVVATGLALARGTAGASLKKSCGYCGAYLALYLAAYAGSGMALPYQGDWGFWIRFAPVWFFATLLFSGCAAHLLERAGPRARELAIGAVALTIAAGLADLGSLLARARPGAPVENLGRLASTKGYDYIEYFDKLVNHLEPSLEARFEVLSRFEDDPRLLLPAAMHSLFEHSGRSLEDAVRFARGRAGSQWRLALLGLGLEAAPRYGHEIPPALARVMIAPEDEREPLAEAVGRVALGLKRTPESIDEATRLPVPPELRRALLLGVGWRIHAMHRLRPDLARLLVDRQPPDAQAALWEGYEAAREANTLRW